MEATETSTIIFKLREMILVLSQVVACFYVIVVA